MPDEKCFYCETKDDNHIEGCPIKIYAEGNTFRANRAVKSFEAGFDDGMKLYPSEVPADPSFRLGQKRGVAEVTP